MWMPLSRQFWVTREMNKWDVKKWGAERLYEAMQILSSTRAMIQVTSALLEMFRRKYDQTQRNKKMSQKQPKLKVIIHAFRFSWGPSSKRHGMPRRRMGGHWKGVMWLGTNMWMPLHSFRCNFGFHEKWTNGVLRGFSRQHKWCQASTQRHNSPRPS